MAYREFDQIALDRRALLRGGALFAGGAVLAGSPLAGLMAQPADANAMWPNVAALLAKFVDARQVANAIAAFGWGQGAPQMVGKGVLTIGESVPANLDSLYRIYSMTKPITGMAAMMLIDEGKLGLDQPLAEILPAFAKMRVQKTYDGSITDLVPAERPITIRNLLTHTAGLGYGIIQKGPIKDYYDSHGLVPGQISRLPIPGLSRTATIEGLDHFADGIARTPLVYQSGTKWSYSVGLDVMGRVIEVVSGMPFDSFLKERIFEPCGMGSTWFRVPESEVGRLTTSYGVINGIPLPIDPPRASIYLDEPPLPSGGAGLVSSPRDYDRFLQMLLGYGMIDGTRVMSERAVRLGTSNLLPAGVITKGTMIDGQAFGAGGRVQPETGAYGWGRPGWHRRFRQLQGGAARQHVHPVHAAGCADPVERLSQSGPRRSRRDERDEEGSLEASGAAMLAFTGCRLDRADHIRADPDALAAQMGWRARLLALDGLMPAMDETGALQWGSLADAAPDAELVFLGLDVDDSGAKPCFAAVPELGDSAPRMANPVLWQAMATLSPGDLALYGSARSIVDWHARHRFCAKCGAATALAKGGWQRTCGTCDAQHFPRTDPVAITLVEHDDGRLMLGRGLGWPEGRFSALAGFVEPGESIEEGVAREVFEESGVRVRDVSYVASQPWPFPSQLMIGCHAFADDDSVTMDTTEMAEIAWFTRAEVEAAMAGADGARFLKPLEQAIATHLIRWWLER